uniref:Cold unfolding four helix bundle n=1 Tax=synthetic construct TaxID=32630 RepID=UPI001EFF5D74|nr:Chain A, Cold unfolding four helix bundle [synthetic construct]7T2Y_A Chain A, Designed cold unfolding four helix bundle [synthetic construct]7T2Y_B Chain B, Designed cold unfolding four helix bundle [synthetic construct]
GSHQEYIKKVADELKENSQNINDLLKEVEKNPEDMEYWNKIYRLLHTNKEIAETAGFSSVAKVEHTAMNLVDKMLNSEIKITSDLIDKIKKKVDMSTREIDKKV